jgi:4-amino-4-deoxy-L-arabinose transferase-like glycosyltransferase
VRPGSTSRGRRLGFRGPALIFLGAVLVRILFVFVVYPLTPGSHPEIVRAGDGYTDIAENLIRGNGYIRSEALGPELQRPPAYPLLNYLVFLVTGVNDRAMVVFQCLVGGLDALLVLWIGNLLISRRVAYLSAAVFAVFPVQIFYTTLLAREALDLPLTAGLAAALWSALSSRSRRRSLAFALLAGALAGLASLTNAMWVLLGGSWCLLTAWLLRTRVRPASAVLALLVVTQAAFILPWTLRNYRVTGRVVPISTSGGLTLWQGTFLMDYPWNSPYEHGQQVKQCLQAAQRIIDRGALNPTPEEDAVFRRLALENIRNHPGRWVRALARNSLRIWYYNARRSRIPFILAMQLPFLLAAAWGLVLLWRASRVTALFLVFPVLYNVVLHMPFVAIVRYSTSSTPFLAIFIGFLIARWIGRSVATGPAH